MPSTLDLLEAPGTLDATPFDTTGKTVAQVVSQICRKLRQTELKPERVVAANYAENANEAKSGPKPDSPWPEAGGIRSRLCLSVSIGRSEGWLVQIDFVRFVEEGDGGHWLSQPLLRIKVLNRSLAWSIAAVVSRLLDID